jgi:hypothetical protein
VTECQVNTNNAATKMAVPCLLCRWNSKGVMGWIILRCVIPVVQYQW